MLRYQHHYQATKRQLRLATTLGLLLAMLLIRAQPASAALQDIDGPSGSGLFGQQVIVLPNGNVVVTDPSYDLEDTPNVGAVYLYDGSTYARISMLTGSTSEDQIGNGGVTILRNGNYVVRSPYWSNGGQHRAGAVTWANRISGVSGAVSAANSLVGSTLLDQLGLGDGEIGGVTALNNGNYVVSSLSWDHAGLVDAGAVTWGDGTTGISGPVSAANSLIGATREDRVGNRGVRALGSGDYLIISPSWDNNGLQDAGAVTWGNGASGIAGPISAATSLIGLNMWDQVGSGGVTLLRNGNYVVRSPFWRNGNASGAGAVTWGDGTRGIVGPVSAANSLVGSTTGDLSTYAPTITALSSGNYLVSSPSWDNGTTVDAGAVTFGNGTNGTIGPISAANSLVGSSRSDRVGIGGVAELSNGNYVLGNPFWDNGTLADAGAVTWGSGSSGVVGPISAANSLVGSNASDEVVAIAALSNGNYVVNAPFWDNGALTDVGAVIWGDGTRGVTGPVSAANSLIGSSANDRVGVGNVRALTNGHYVVSSPSWDHGTITDAGAITWGDGTRGITGSVSAVNSLVGSSIDDQVGLLQVKTLSNGNYVVNNPWWDDGAIADAGAVTWGNGASGTAGLISAANSLVGSHAFDRIGVGGITTLSTSNYVVSSPIWDDSNLTDVGAVTWGDGTTGIAGPISASNSLVGSTAADQVGSEGATALSNGNYVVSSPRWDNGNLTDVGAATWGDGTTGIAGPISASNSLVGASPADAVGAHAGDTGSIVPLANGDYLVQSFGWDNGDVTDAGAITWGSGILGVCGVVSGLNSAVGRAPGSGTTLFAAFHVDRDIIVASFPAENRIVVITRVVPALTWAQPTAITYGTRLSAAQLNASASVAGQAVAGSFSYSPPMGTLLNAGSAQVLTVTFIPDDTATYASVSAQVEISVAGAPLTITAVDQTMVQGQAVPMLTAEYHGFVNGDDASDLDVPLALTTAATSASPPGPYAILASGAADANYAITLVSGTLTIEPRPPAVYLPWVVR